MATAGLRQLLTSAFTAESSIRYSQGSGAVFQQRLTYQSRQGPDLADGPRSLGLILKNIQGTHNSSRNKHQTGLGNRVNECVLLTLAMSQLQEFGQSLPWMLTMCAETIHHSFLPLDVYGLKTILLQRHFLKILTKPTSLFSCTLLSHLMFSCTQ